MNIDHAINKVPILGLRMKSIPPLPSSSSSGLSSSLIHHDEESISVMVKQDHTYKCRDYIRRRRRKRHTHTDSPTTTAITIDNDNNINNMLVDEICREKMCEWCYKVCDHFNTEREIVSYTFSFLDRFIDLCCCDRTAYKLAAMTCLYIATKLCNIKQLSIATLAELSRGEFDIEHIAEMEYIILETLQWKMNPPTIQSYILYFRNTMISNYGIDMVDNIYERSIFFAELSIYDYIFINDNKYIIAIACYLNAIECCCCNTSSSDNNDILHKKNNHSISNIMKKEFNIMLSNSIFYGIDRKAIEKVQSRLWYLYTCSAQIQYDDDIIIPNHIQHQHNEQQRSNHKLHNNNTNTTTASSYSPVSVNHMKG